MTTMIESPPMVSIEDMRREVFNEAADLIDEYGLTYQTLRDPSGYCPIGAVARVVFGADFGPFGDNPYICATNMFGVPFTEVYEWNDRVKPSKERVVKVLRLMADGYSFGEARHKTAV